MPTDPTPVPLYAEALAFIARAAEVGTVPSWMRGEAERLADRLRTALQEGAVDDR